MMEYQPDKGHQNASHSHCSFKLLPFYVSELDKNLQIPALNVSKVQDGGRGYTNKATPRVCFPKIKKHF